MDVPHVAEHREDPVQSLRLLAESEQHYASNPCLDSDWHPSGTIPIFVATIGMKCMKCMEDDEVQKMRMAVIGGVIFLISGKRGSVSFRSY